MSIEALVVFNLDTVYAVTSPYRQTLTRSSRGAAHYWQFAVFRTGRSGFPSGRLIMSKRRKLGLVKALAIRAKLCAWPNSSGTLLATQTEDLIVSGRRTR